MGERVFPCTVHVAMCRSAGSGLLSCGLSQLQTSLRMVGLMSASLSIMAWRLLSHGLIYDFC
jgi:hypothetical protein